MSRSNIYQLIRNIEFNDVYVNQINDDFLMNRLHNIRFIEQSFRGLIRIYPTLMNSPANQVIKEIRSKLEAGLLREDSGRILDNNYRDKLINFFLAQENYENLLNDTSSSNPREFRRSLQLRRTLLEIISSTIDEEREFLATIILNVDQNSNLIIPNNLIQFIDDEELLLNAGREI